MKGMPYTHFLMVPIRGTTIHDAMNRFAAEVSIPIVRDPHITLGLYRCSTDEDLRALIDALDSISTSKCKIRSKGLVCFVGQQKRTISSLQEFPNGQILADATIQCSRIRDLYDKQRWPVGTQFQRNYHITFKGTQGYLKKPFLIEALKLRSEWEFGELICDELHLCKMHSINGIYEVVHRKQLQ
jgi:2'-5' RNA ligase